MALVAVNLCLCAHNTRGAYTVQRYLLMLLVAAETVSRTCIATLLFLIANVSACLLASLFTIFRAVGLGHHAFLLRARGSDSSRQVPRNRIHMPQCLLRHDRRRQYARDHPSK